MTVSLTRTGARRARAANGRGPDLPIGPAEDPDTWTPGELLQAALGGCNLMSADKVIERRLGEDFRATATVTTERVPGENRYGSGVVTMHLDTSGLGAEDAEQLRGILERAVAAGCTIGRTLDAGLPHTLVIEG